MYCINVYSSSRATLHFTFLEWSQCGVNVVNVESIWGQCSQCNVQLDDITCYTGLAILIGLASTAVTVQLIVLIA